ncbi:Hypothetical_protein [Hexamita inflata]|uniref:Hypothetical_protein n=1 Tax=Hexamita inflata TaxID=28002 RepID=A0AA86P1S4_9EUKA|nr:Hypothetical protein HINF_LOCUS17153 [Hexamita inflata]
MLQHYTHETLNLGYACCQSYIYTAETRFLKPFYFQPYIPVGSWSNKLLHYIWLLFGVVENQCKEVHLFCTLLLTNRFIGLHGYVFFKLRIAAVACYDTIRHISTEIQVSERFLKIFHSQQTTVPVRQQSSCDIQPLLTSPAEFCNAQKPRVA